jgi:hypothetical protein
MKKLILFCCYLSLCCHLPAQNIFDLLLVPDNIKKNASVIKRSEEIVFEVKDIDNASYKVHQVFTVLNENGKKNLFFLQHSNKFIRLVDVDIKLYDALGKQTEKYKKKDLQFLGIGDGLIDDGKMNYINVKATNFPVTIEIDWEEQYSGTLFYPPYQIQEPDEGVIQSKFIAKVPKNLDLRYKEKNVALKPVITETTAGKVYEWSVSNLSPIAYEEGSVSFESRYPAILLAPNKFKMEDFEGDMTSWEKFGDWYYRLTRGMDNITDERKQFFQALVKDATTDKQKIKILYEYLQKNFRYVSIQLGLGGYRPISAKFTDEKKYGDCKGLSNMMQTALSAVGIKSYQALINAEYNREPVDPAFPCNQFNHVILCVPQPKDTVWLECTSQTNDFGVLGSFTENRKALLITEKGGALISTPESKPEHNTLYSYTLINLDADGSSIAKTRFTANGEFKQELNHFLLEEKQDDQKDYIINRLGFKMPDEFNITNKSSESVFSLELEMAIRKVSELNTSTKMFLVPRLEKIWSRSLPKSENRSLDFYFRYPFIRTDTSVFKLPAVYKSDALPKAKQLQCKDASFKSEYWYNEKENAVYSAVTLVLNKNRINVVDYAAIKKMFDEIQMDESQRIVIKKNSDGPLKPF